MYKMRDIKERLFTVLLILAVFCIILICSLNDYKLATKNNNSNNYERIKFPGVERSDGYDCSKLEFSSTKLPITALASYPGSGSTWLRHLLQKMTGIATGSVYNDKVLKSHGFPGEGRQDGSVVATKTHHNYNQKRKNYDGVILLIRNPYEALLSRFKYRTSHSHVGQPNLDVFMEAWKYFFAQAIDKYRDFHISWIQHPKLLPVLYDDLKSNVPKSLSQIHSFLNTSSVGRNIKCCLEDAEGGFHRNQTYSMPFKFLYSKNDILKIDKIILEIQVKLSNRFSSISFQPMMGWTMN